MVHPTTQVTEQGTGRKPLIQVNDLKVHFPVTSGLILQRRIGAIRAVDGVTLSIGQGETFGLVGESGSGKSTLGRAIIRLQRPTAGQVSYADQDITHTTGGRLRSLRRHLQIIFQDPYASLDPRMTVGEILREPLVIHKLVRGRQEQRKKVDELLELVGLNAGMAQRYPHEFSGGQRQRIGIARAIAVSPDFIVADEPVSALDVSIQAQIINLMKQLQEQLGLTYLFIGHDLSVVRHISTRVGVMYLGKLMELAPRNDLYDKPLHPYTKALLAAVPVPDPDVEAQRERIVIEGDIPSPQNPPSGCVFHTRCPVAKDECKTDVPAYRNVAPDHWVACHFA